MTEQIQGSAVQVKSSSGGKQKKPTSLYRKIRRKFAKTPLRKPLLWLAHRNLTPADIFIAAYPKSGITYLRFVLFEILSGRSAGFRSTNELMTGIGKHGQSLRLLPGGGRLIGTHEQYRKEYKKAIYLVRDARDVVSSEFAFLSALEYFRGDLDKFIDSFLFTCCVVHGIGPWHRNVHSWLDSPIAGTGNMLLVRYEDVRQDPMTWFSRMIEFLGMDVDREKIRAAIENNSLQKMREMEKREPVRASIKGRFVRDGAVRGWTSRLTPAQIRLIEEHAGSALLRLGYPLSSQLSVEPGAPEAREQTDTCRV